MSLPASSVAMSSGVFKRSNCHPSDHRNKLYEQLLIREHIDEEAITTMARNNPKIFSYQYVFPYPFKRKRKTTIFPLSRLLCLKPSLSLVQLVHKAHPDAMQASDESGRYPLHYACRFRAPKEVVQYLIAEYPDAVDKKISKSRALPLHHACGNYQHVDIVKQLIDCGKAGSLQEEAKYDCWTPLHFAAAYEPAEDVIPYLVSIYPYGVKAVTRNGKLPLHLVCQSRRSLPDIEALVSAFPETVRIPESHQQLPIHIACRSQLSIDIIHYLVECYPEGVAAACQQGKTPLDYAKDEASEVVVKFLEAVTNDLDKLVELQDEKRVEVIDTMLEEVLRVTAKAAPSSDLMHVECVDEKAKQTNNLSSREEEMNDEASPSPAPQRHAIERTKDLVSAAEEVAVRSAAAHDRSSEQSGRDASRDDVTPSPGAVRIRGIHAPDRLSDDDNDNVSYGSTAGSSLQQQQQHPANFGSSATIVVTNTPIAAEVAPRISELEAQLEAYRQRIGSREIVEADEVIPDPSTKSRTTSSCCIIL